MMKPKKRKLKDSLKVFCLTKFQMELGKFVKSKYKEGLKIAEVAKILKCSYQHAQYLKDKFNCKYEHKSGRVKCVK